MTSSSTTRILISGTGGHLGRHVEYIRAEAGEFGAPRPAFPGREAPGMGEYKANKNALTQRNKSEYYAQVRRGNNAYFSPTSTRSGADATPSTRCETDQPHTFPHRRSPRQT